MAVSEGLGRGRTSPVPSRLHPERSLLRTVAVSIGVVSGYVVLGVVAATMLLPFFWMLSTSLKSTGKIFILPPQWIPNPFRWANYSDLFDILPFGRFIINTTYIAALSTFGHLLSCALGAFAFARLRFPGKEFLFMVLLATMMIPGHVTLIPVFVMMRAFNWIDTHYPLIVPAFFGGPFGVFLMRQAFFGVPQDFLDAARIDGASLFHIWWRIFLPLAKPALATLGLFTFMGSWNDLMGPLIFLNTTAKYTLSLGVAMLSGSETRPGRFAYVMAGATISVIPVVAIFLYLQRYFVAGVLRGGLKA